MSVTSFRLFGIVPHNAPDSYVGAAGRHGTRMSFEDLVLITDMSNRDPTACPLTLLLFLLWYTHPRNMDWKGIDSQAVILPPYLPVNDPIIHVYCPSWLACYIPHMTAWRHLHVHLCPLLFSCIAFISSSFAYLRLPFLFAVYVRVCIVRRLLLNDTALTTLKYCRSLDPRNQLCVQIIIDMPVAYRYTGVGTVPEVWNRANNFIRLAESTTSGSYDFYNRIEGRLSWASAYTPICFMGGVKTRPA